jgi:hypothetical protein
MTEKTFTFEELLDKEEVERAYEHYHRPDGTPFAAWAAREIFTPEKMAHINAKLGQENDAGYFAYALEYVLSQGGEP